MQHSSKIIDRKLGRNAQLFAQTVSEMDTAEIRYPYLRILVSLIENAHTDWRNAPDKEAQICGLIDRLTDGGLESEEIVAVVRSRDE